jgi:hypothetical protein
LKEYFKLPYQQWNKKKKDKKKQIQEVEKSILPVVREEIEL